MLLLVMFLPAAITYTLMMVLWTTLVLVNIWLTELFIQSLCNFYHNEYYLGRPRKLLRQQAGGQRLSGLGQRSPGLHLGGQRYLGGGFRHLIGKRKPRFNNPNLYAR